MLHSRIRRCTWSLHQGFGKLQVGACSHAFAVLSRPSPDHEPLVTTFRECKQERCHLTLLWILDAKAESVTCTTQADLDPLKAQLRKRDKLLQGEERLRQQRKEQQLQQQQQAEGGAGGGGGGAEVGAGADGLQQHAQLRGPLSVSVEGEEEERALGKAAQPMPTVQRVNAADAAQWRRTDNIIMAVLSRCARLLMSGRAFVGGLLTLYSLQRAHQPTGEGRESSAKRAFLS